MTSEAWWASKLCDGKRESQEGLWELMLEGVQSKEGRCGRDGCVAHGPSHAPWVDLTPAGRAVFLVVFMLHSGAAGWVPAFHRGSWCSFATGRSPRKTSLFEDPKDFALGMGRVGELLGWEGGPHPGCFMRFPLKRLHEPQVSTRGQSTPMTWVLMATCEKALGAPET